MVSERPVRLGRRLSAILVADVAGYSRLMHNDEEATHTKLTALTTEAVHPAIAEHGGRIVKNTGDGFLAEFPSAVEAVRAAVQFQNRIKELTSAEMEDRRIALRVGVNIGDVIVEPHDIFGDDVNIAARLECIAQPGGICISASTYDRVRGKVGVEFTDLGEQNLKNIARPVRAYALVPDAGNPATQPRGIKPNPPSPPHLSIVVLPFANLCGDPEQDYFVDGVTESLTTDLSRISGSFVIGRHTAFTYKGKVIDLRQIGRELNVRYALEGSVQRSGKRLRLNVQLVDAETGAHLWADRFDKPITDLFDMQDEIVSHLANALNAQLTEIEAQRSERSPHRGSMDLCFQGKASWNKGWTPEHMAQARAFFEQALFLDPRNIEAMVGIAVVHLVIGSNFFTDERTAHLVMAEAVLGRVLSLAPNHAFAHLALGGVLMCSFRPAQGVAECERALALDRNLAEAHALIGWAKYFMGCGAETETHVSEAFRLSPRDILSFQWSMMVGFAKLQVNEDAEALDWFHRSIEANRNHPTSHFGLAAALALLGKQKEARAVVNVGLALNPTFTIKRFKSFSVSDNPTFLAGAKRAVKGFHLAGVPEG